ncbi:hypothetical protein [Kineosporia mesophila]|uniref:hypothetical protein n=1 Tax=Kineosporia mesophila TaxID=566012 RepID=UPI001E43094D|nr:hypothetical protein [Kineosporia mesophila]MCD5352749.1 hypothetical protein [Kineosporia mesophila]
MGKRRRTRAVLCSALLVAACSTSSGYVWSQAAPGTLIPGTPVTTATPGPTASPGKVMKKISGSGRARLAFAGDVHFQGAIF